MNSNIEHRSIHDKLGPTYYKDLTPVADSDGIRVSTSVPIVKVDAMTAWQGQWIWLNEKDFPDDQTCRATTFCAQDKPHFTVAVFRKVIDLETIPTKVIARVSADTKYRLYVNGRRAGRGPAEVGGDYGNTQSPDWWFYDTYDLAEFFKNGKNVIVAEVVLDPIVQADYSMGRGGFLFDAVLRDAKSSETTVVSDKSWRATRNNAWVSPDTYDARKDLDDVWDVAYNDAFWPMVDVVSTVSEGIWKLVPREIPPLMEARIFPTAVIPPGGRSQRRLENPNNLIRESQDPARITPGASVTFNLRFDRELTGFVQYRVKAAAGTLMKLEYQEVPGHTDTREQYILCDGLQSAEGIKLQGFENIQVTVTFPKGCHTPLEIYHFTVNFISFPVPYRGRFTSSDDLLNRIWAVGRWTNQFCMQGYHMDSPIHQEGLGCTGDYMIESLISYYTFGEARLARQDILRTAWLLKQKDFKMFHTSYSLLWIQMLYDYWYQTADAETLRTVMPMVHGLLARFGRYIGKTGLITEAPNYMFMDWGPVDEFDMHHPPCVMGQGYMSVFYYKALENAARLCELTDSLDLRTEYHQRAENLKIAFNRELWVEEKGLYCNGKPFTSSLTEADWLPPDVDRIFYSLHTNALAVAYGLSPKDCSCEILHRAMKDQTLPTVQPYFMHYVFEALVQADLFDDLGLTEIRKWKSILDEHPSSLKECWKVGDYSHAWSGTPTYQLSSRVLGASPLLPGWKAIRICPHPGDLSWAAGTIPTPLGDLEIDWRLTERAFTLNLTVPEEATAELFLAKRNKKNAKLTQGGAEIESDQRILETTETDSHIVLKILGGRFQFCLEVEP